ncbi:MAG: SseB family protein [Methanobrevibacter sp.]|nr:SseB family protein [Methanobrevibacter sp.]
MNNIKELLAIKPDEATKEDNEELIKEIMNAQLIMPIEITSNLNLDEVTVGDTIEFEDGLRFKPLKIANDNGNVFIPLYTDDDEVHGHTSAIDIHTSDLADMIDDNPENISGVVINPFSEYSVEIPMESFLKIFEKEKD